MYVYAGEGIEEVQRDDVLGGVCNTPSTRVNSHVDVKGDPRNGVVNVG